MPACAVSTITREQLLAFRREELYAVQASVSASSTPQAAIVGVIVSDRFEVFFDTLGTSRKPDNLRHNPAVALVIGPAIGTCGERKTPQGFSMPSDEHR